MMTNRILLASPAPGATRQGRWSVAAVVWGLVLLASGMRPGRLEAQSIPVTVRGPASSFVGQGFDLPIEVDLTARPERLGSFVLRLQWNPAVLRLAGGVSGDFGDLSGDDEDS